MLGHVRPGLVCWDLLGKFRSSSFRVSKLRVHKSEGGNLSQVRFCWDRLG
jgi:hypothetical protein